MEFTILYVRLAPRLRWLARRHSNGSVLTKEDDLYQEMCIYLWDHYGEGVPEGINDAYIVKGCEFHIRNYIRTHKEKVALRSLEAPINDNGDTLKELLPADTIDTDRHVDKKLTIDAIMNNGFTPREKQVFSLLLKGYTTREAGKRLGISHVRVTRLKKSLVERWHKKKNGRLPE